MFVVFKNDPIDISIMMKWLEMPVVDRIIKLCRLAIVIVLRVMAWKPLVQYRLTCIRCVLKKDGQPFLKLLQNLLRAPRHSHVICI